MNTKEDEQVMINEPSSNILVNGRPVSQDNPLPVWLCVSKGREDISVWLSETEARSHSNKIKGMVYCQVLYK